ncbi:proteophosphoglycan ppg4 [Rhodotorula toruloides]|uniref:Proteophosphoglycan ppg4 n=1 Tax=Rhodotorula toruloides TaxID=5286 RepID=A0A511KL85_RHOTO|nr:proteophosphoglycan ppg4 [Rhodotorula toruloides]
MPSFNLRKRANTVLGSSASPSIGPLQTRTQPFAPSSPVSPPSPTFARPIKQIRRQSRSFSTFTTSLQLFASPATPTSSNQFAPQSPRARDEGHQLKRTISYPLLVHTSLGFDNDNSPDWFGTRDTTQRFANTSSFVDWPTSFGNCLTVDDTESFSISFPRLDDEVDTSETNHRRFSDESCATPTRATFEYEAFNEVSRFSASTESSPSTCELVPSEQSHRSFNVSDDHRAKSPGDESLFDLDFDMTSVVPLSPPPSPEEYRHQPLPVSCMSSSPQAWFGRPIDEDTDIVDPMMACSYSPTPAGRAAGRFKRPSSILTPPQTPSLHAIMAEQPSPLVPHSPVATLRSSASYSSPWLLSLAIEELSTEFERAETLSILTTPTRKFEPFPCISLESLPPRPATPTPSCASSLDLSQPFPLPPRRRALRRVPDRLIPAPILTSQPRVPRTRSSSPASYTPSTATPLASPSLFSPISDHTFLTASTPISPFTPLTDLHGLALLDATTCTPAPPPSPRRGKQRRRPVIITPVTSPTTSLFQKHVGSSGQVRMSL